MPVTCVLGDGTCGPGRAGVRREGGTGASTGVTSVF